MTITVLEKPPMLICSFCGKDRSEVFELIAGPIAFICDEGVELCVNIIAKKRGKRTPEPEERK